jgi:fatty acid desaturase
MRVFGVLRHRRHPNDACCPAASPHRAALPPPLSLRSLAHVAGDLAVSALLLLFASCIPAFSASPLLASAGWFAYWAAQGVQLTGVWVLAHECGHGAFSPSQRLNDAVGLLLHSALLVPYHPW